jgi:hypothetical protein
MVMVSAADLSGIEEQLALRVFAGARSIAPCIASIDPLSDEGREVLALLRGIAADADMLAPGDRLVASEKSGTQSVTYSTSWYSVDDRTVLRSYCTGSASTSGGSIGVFPTARPIVKLWPEDA